MNKAREKRISAAVEVVRKLIDEVTSPREMSKEEYDDFLEELAGEIEMRQDCRIDEKKNED